MPRIILGEEIAEKEIYPNLKTVKDKPILIIFFDKNKQSSKNFIEIKNKRAQKANVKIEFVPYPKSQKKLENKVFVLNKDSKINGIFLQMPLPKEIGQEAIYLLSDLKDVAGFYSKFFVPPLVQAVRRVLQEIPGWRERKILIAGQDEFISKKIYYFISRENNKIVTALNHKILKLLLKKNDIIISFFAKPNLIKARDSREILALIDIGFFDSQGKIKGSIEEESYNKAQLVFPARRGVEALADAYLMANVWQAYDKQK